MRIASVVAAVALSAATLALPAAPSLGAGSPGCATRSEFVAVHAGMTLARTRQVLGTRGQLARTLPAGYIYLFRTCKPGVWATVDIGYDETWANPRVHAKLWDSDTPGCATPTEWRLVDQRRRTRYQIRSILDLPGTRTATIEAGQLRRYRRCDQRGNYFVYYTYEDPTLTLWSFWF